jgi:hypothetical protein
MKRPILKRAVGRSRTGVAYETFRDLILTRMADADFQPLGMATVVHLILSD